MTAVSVPGPVRVRLPSNQADRKDRPVNSGRRRRAAVLVAISLDWDLRERHLELARDLGGEIRSGDDR